MAGWQVDIEVFDAREWMVPRFTTFQVAIKGPFPVGVLTACCGMLLHWLLNIILLATVRTHNHFICCRGIWPMLGPLMLMVALLGWIFPVTLRALVLGATYTSLLMVPQHAPHHQHLVTVPTRELLTSVHIHMFPETIWCLEGQVTYGVSCILPTNGRNLIRNLWYVPSICPTCWQLLPSNQCSYLPFHGKKGRLLDNNLIWHRTLRNTWMHLYLQLLLWKHLLQILLLLVEQPLVEQGLLV